MSIEKKRSAMALAALAAALMAGCTRSGAQANTSSASKDDVVVTPVAGTVECDGEPLLGGLIIFTDRSQDDRWQKHVHTDWAPIIDGRYTCKHAPVGEDTILVVTDPDDFVACVKQLGGGNAPRGDRRSRTNRDMGSPRSQERRRSGALIPPDGPESSPSPSESPSPGRRRGNGPLPEITSDAASRLPAGFSLEPGDDPRYLGVLVLARQAKEGMEKVSNEQREILQKVNKKYGNYFHGIHETISEGQKELNLKLTTD